MSNRAAIINDLFDILEDVELEPFSHSFGSTKKKLNSIKDPDLDPNSRISLCKLDEVIRQELRDDSITVDADFGVSLSQRFNALENQSFGYFDDKGVINALVSEGTDSASALTGISGENDDALSSSSSSSNKIDTTTQQLGSVDEYSTGKMYFY